uniref:Matrilin 1 n=1 Tax=Gadus morhua TaxID=8049 RepID=A0A8C5ATW0_GADMO
HHPNTLEPHPQPLHHKIPPSCPNHPLLLSLPPLRIQDPPHGPVFIVDSSRSVRPSEFRAGQVFLAKVIEGLGRRANATRVGVVNYGPVSLKTYRTKAGLVKAVTKIEPLSTGTMTGLAIQFALNVAFSESEGARVKSPDIIKVAIIGAQRAATPASSCSPSAVGRVDMNTLRQMASEPLDDHVDYVESYSVIEKLTKKFQEAFCVSDLCATGDHDCEQVCISTPGSFKCACKDGFTLLDDGRSCSGEWRAHPGGYECACVCVCVLGAIRSEVNCVELHFCCICVCRIQDVRCGSGQRRGGRAEGDRLRAHGGALLLHGLTSRPMTQIAKKLQINICKGLATHGPPA